MLKGWAIALLIWGLMIAKNTSFSAIGVPVFVWLISVVLDLAALVALIVMIVRTIGWARGKLKKSTS